MSAKCQELSTGFKWLIGEFRRKSRARKMLGGSTTSCTPMARAAACFDGISALGLLGLTSRTNTVALGMRSCRHLPSVPAALRRVRP
jgi:hypothetical protein